MAETGSAGIVEQEYLRPWGLAGSPGSHDPHFGGLIYIERENGTFCSFGEFILCSSLDF
jgi:hypothetical protein